MTSRVSIAISLWLLALAGAGACGGKAIFDAEGGAGGTGAGTTSVGAGPSVGGAGGSGGGTGGVQDPLLTQCPGNMLVPCDTVLVPITDASDWGEDAVFVGVDDRFVAGNRTPNGVTRPFVLEVFDDGGISLDVLEIPLVGAVPPFAEAIDLAEAAGKVELLLCDPQECRIWIDAPSGIAMAVMPPVPAGIDPVGIVVPLPGRRCVFGDGVACAFQGTWTTYAEPGSGPRWRAADGANGTAWFVGDEGAIGRFSAEGWTSYESPTQKTLHAVMARDGKEAVAAGEQGAVVVINDSGARLDCAATDSDWRGVGRFYGGPGHDEFALLADNHWFLKDPSSNQWCSFGVTTTTSPVEVDLVKCGDSSSWRLLLEGRLYGGDGCFVN